MNYKETITDEWNKLRKTITKSKYFSHVPFDDIIIQNQGEIINFIDFVMRRNDITRPINFIEIGSRQGGTFVLFGNCFTRAFSEVNGVAIDLPNQPHEPMRKKELIKGLAALQPKFPYKVILDNSHKPETLALAQSFFATKLDMIFIDGDHSEKGSYQDFVDYSTLLRPGGIIAYHDIVEPKQWPWVQVHKTWARIKKEHSKNQIVEWKLQNNGYGIGAIIL